MYVLVRALIIHFFIYLASPALNRTCLCFLQPVLRQEKLWKQERDSVRPRHHRQVGCVPLLLTLSLSLSLRVNEGMST